MPFKKFVEIGRVAYIADGPEQVSMGHYFYMTFASQRIHSKDYRGFYLDFILVNIVHFTSKKFHLIINLPYIILSEVCWQCLGSI